jgi:hypothetical protein
MTQDAKFEDASEAPIALRATDAQDLEVISALIQDAICPVGEIQWNKDDKCFGMLLNRFRWEDKDRAKIAGRNFERVQTVLMANGVSHVLADGVSSDNKEQILSILSVSFEETDTPAGRLIITLAGDGAFALDMECIDLVLKDVTRPYIAPSKQEPTHSLD